MPRALPRRAAEGRVFGGGGPALGRSRTPFSAETTAEGAVGQRRTAAALEALLRIPGTRVFHGLRVPGRGAGDIDHAVVNGDRVVYIDTKFYRPGEYRWLPGGQLGRGRDAQPYGFVNMERVLRDPRTGRVAAEVAGHVVIHPNAPGAVTFVPGGQVSAIGVPATGPQQGVEMIGRWLMEGSRAGLVDRYLLRRLADLMR